MSDPAIYPKALYLVEGERLDPAGPLTVRVRNRYDVQNEEEEADLRAQGYIDLGDAAEDVDRQEKERVKADASASTARDAI